MTLKARLANSSLCSFKLPCWLARRSLLSPHIGVGEGQTHLYDDTEEASTRFHIQWSHSHQFRFSLQNIHYGPHNTEASSCSLAIQNYYQYKNRNKGVFHSAGGKIQKCRPPVTMWSKYENSLLGIELTVSHTIWKRETEWGNKDTLIWNKLNLRIQQSIVIRGGSRIL